MTKPYTLHLGDCIEVMKTLPDNSVDAVVTDPPYHLTTGKKGGSGQASVNLETPYGRARIGTGFMGMKWDGGDIAQSVELWTEVLRVLKPGGHLLAFSGTRTQHRMVCSIEDAGFEVRDQIGWAFGSGFPKSRNISDDMTDGADEWQGWGTALKPAWEPICVARKPLAKGCTVAANVLEYGTGALNIDGCRVGMSQVDKEFILKTARPNTAGQESGNQVYGALKPTVNVHDAGRWPANLIHDGSDEVVAAFPDAKGQQGAVTGNEPTANGFSGAVQFGGMNGRVISADPRIEIETSAARFFYCAKASRADRNSGLTDPGPQFKRGTTLRKVEDTATTGNIHPTVKPTDLMAYLCRLVTQPGGVVLDPFMGSGSTGKAAIREGFQFIGIEMEQQYMDIATARISHELKLVEDAEAAAIKAKAEADAQPVQLSLID